MQSITDDNEISFINRSEEMMLVREVLGIIVAKGTLTAYPIINFFAVDGIGKTKILQKTASLCLEQDLPYIELNMHQGTETLPKMIIERVRQYTHQKHDQSKTRRRANDKQAIEAIKRLLKNSPIVLLFDAVDVSKEDTVLWIKSLLHEVLESNNVCAILGSKQKLVFENDWSMARKLRTHQVKPLDRGYSLQYLTSRNDTISDEVREIIFQWTRGYPLAMNVIVQALHNNKKFDITKSVKDQQQLISILMEEVIDKKILAQAKDYELGWYKAYLSLLSVPRQFNLIIMQRLLENFPEPYITPSDNVLEYIALPRKINAYTDILHWNLQKTGFAVDESVRNLFLRERRIHKPESFVKIHRFLAEQNRQLISGVPRADSVHYLREYLYHYALGYEGSDIKPLLEEILQRLKEQSPYIEAFSAITQFQKEFDRDKEFKEILGNDAKHVFKVVEKYLS